MKTFKVMLSEPHAGGSSLAIETLECDHLHVTEQGVLVATRNSPNDDEDDDGPGEVMVKMYSARHWLSVEGQ